MNTIKKVIKSVSVAAVAVMLMGGVFAFASQSEYIEPNMYHDGTQWVPLTPDTEFECERATTDCVGYSPDLTQPIPETIEKGQFNLL